jgi:DNA-binding MarR family transcriptional regulator
MTANDLALAGEIHRLLVSLIQRIKAHEDTSLEPFELTRMEAKALYRLEPGETVPVRTIAERGHVDPSNLSPAVESLEARGLVERPPARHDRRIRAVRLTPEGEELRRQLADALHDGYPAVARLSVEQQRLLRDLLAQTSSSSPS